MSRSNSDAGADGRREGAAEVPSLLGAGTTDDVDALLVFLHSFLMLLTDMRLLRSFGFGKVSRSSIIESAENRLEGGFETTLALSGGISSAP